MDLDTNVKDFINEKMGEARDVLESMNKANIQQQISNEQFIAVNTPLSVDMEKLEIANTHVLNSDTFKQLKGDVSRDDIVDIISSVGADLGSPAQIECAADALGCFYSGTVSFEEVSALFDNHGNNMSDFRRECCVELFSALAQADAEDRPYGEGVAGELIDSKYSNAEIVKFAEAIRNDRDPMVIASVTELETMNDVEKIFDEEQMSALKECAELPNMTQKKLMLCMNPDLFPEQMKEIGQAVADNLGFKSIEAISDPALNRKKMELIRTSMKDMNSEQRKLATEFVSPDLSYKQMEACMTIIKDGKIPKLSNEVKTVGKVQKDLDFMKEKAKKERQNHQSEHTKKLQTVKRHEAAI